MFERLKRLDETESKYPGLQKAISTAKYATADHFKRYRRDTETVIPPLLLCEAKQLNRIVEQATASSKYKPDLVRRYAHFQPLEGVVYVAREEIQEELLKRKEGVQFIAGVMAEEFSHAFTTFTYHNSTRTGFIEIPYSAHPHGLTPGYVYEHDLDPYSE